ncbi:hypothetical protein [Rhizomicrobium electricum]|uniref:hypothetical protein n=1 Tax=Rhizomicrobium electricum TaxID=480070 RepID=UPI0014211FFB|nr:hypothetical protein [Rhizomicrobium electricum]
MAAAAASQGERLSVSTPQNETNAPVDRRLTTASGGGGGLEAEGGILRFRLWYMERFAGIPFSDHEARPKKRAAARLPLCYMGQKQADARTTCRRLTLFNEFRR